MIGKELRDNPISVNFTDSELKLIDGYRDRLQLVNKKKVSRADVIVMSIKHAMGTLILSKTK